ncbi:MAG TPA: carboxypeptidase regulatory-like domain-containing protein [Gemmatimonadaceae bacterium]|jgi:hypothetical protein|nr:carboxypeptidase regulatory-like domain-containing protein [Gemmatimonadaceae bacterium]
MILVRAAALSLIPCLVVAQTGHVVGSVVDKVAAVALPFSGVSVAGLSTDRLTSDSGAFQIDLPAGMIRLRVRHVGFTPVDTQLVVRANDTTRVRIELSRIPVTLAAVRVTDEACRSPGAPTASDALAQVFQQLQLNAEQFRLVSARYPFTSVVERRFSHLVEEPKPRQKSDSVARADTISVITKTDSIQVPSDQKWHYKPGDIIVASGVSVLGVRYAVMIPTLAVFADAEFVKHHCFHDVGETTVDGQTFRRVDFKAAQDIDDPDIDGTMYLDPATYVIRRSAISLSKKSRYTSSYDSVVVETTFDELVSGVPVITFSVGRNVLPRSGGRPGRANSLPDGSRMLDDEESQRVREIRFIHDVPGLGDASTPDGHAPRVVRLGGSSSRRRVLGVFDAESGAPVAGAAVRDSASGKSALTTATGTVSLGFVPRSSATIQVERAGYERASMPVSLTLTDTLPLTVVLRRVRAPR